MNSYIIYLFFLFSASATCAATLNISIKSKSGDAIENAVVTLSNKNTRILQDNKSTYIIDQIDKTFIPAVITIPLGSKVNFPNKDNIRHHVYSFSETKKFELPLYKGTPAKPITFDKAGIVVLGCNIHDWMKGYIFISDTPYYGQTDKFGNIKIVNIPDGDYLLRVWQPRIKNYNSNGTSITISKNKNISYKETIELKPAIKIRRAPASRRREY